MIALLAAAAEHTFAEFGLVVMGLLVIAFIINIASSYSKDMNRKSSHATSLLFIALLIETSVWTVRSFHGGSQAGAWIVLAQTRGRPEVGERIVLTGRDGAEGQSLELLGRAEGGAWLARPLGVAANEPAEVVLARVGRVPLPGYIRGGVERDGDLDRYQTVFAREAGSAAAPTAGLHFTPEIFADLAARGVERAAVTLHVGLGTFRPITADSLDGHVMHSEWCTCPAETVEAVQRTKARGGRVVAVGTTAVRTLETAARAGTLSPWSGATDLFITPGFPFRVVDALLTNFHMPRTTLMVLVSAMATRDLVMRAYAEAIRERYRMLSYGDAMLIL